MTADWASAVSWLCSAGPGIVSWLTDNLAVLLLAGQVVGAVGCACCHRYRMLAVLVFTTLCTLVGVASQGGLL